MTNVLNLMIAVVNTGVLPTLVPKGASAHIWLRVLVSIHAVLSLALLSGYAAALSRSPSVLSGVRASRLLDRVRGVVLIRLGLRVALEAQ